MKRSVLDIFFPKTRQGLLVAFLLRPEKWWYLAEVASHLGSRPSNFQRDIKAFLNADLIVSRKDGGRIYYRVNPHFPALRDLQSLFIKTAGIAEIIKGALIKQWDKIDLAIIYGSIARGEDLSTSDVDVLIVGNVQMMSLVMPLRKAEEILGREINPMFFSTAEFSQKINAKNAFLMTLKKQEKIFLKGTARDFEP